PMFETSTKPTRVPVGPGYAREFIERFPDTPHLALGGVTPDNIDKLVAAGVRGVAVCSAVCGAEDPGGVVRRLRQAIGSAAPDRRPKPTGAAASP
ncbi:MAG: thiamine phosphate synthase, partial [Planctomycetota bacterium]